MGYTDELNRKIHPYNNMENYFLRGKDKHMKKLSKQKCTYYF
jgi:hypothetical protein